MPEVHALLSASSAHRWLNCAPSARLELSEGHDECSIYAEEGTAAHALAELKLSYAFHKIDRAEYQRRLTEWHKIPVYEKYYTTEFEEYVDQHVSFVQDICREYADDESFNIYFEVQVDFSNVVPQGFGTADVLIITRDKIHVIDLKFGRGVPVSAQNNPQLRLYAFGALNMFPRTKIVEMTINQPRLDSHDTERISQEELIKWAFEYVKPRADAAIEGIGSLNPSESACKFCKLRGKCKARSDMQLSLAKQEFSIVQDKQDITQLTVDQLSTILQIAPAFVEWFNDVQSFAVGQVLAGVKIPGFKMVEGRSNRIITDEQKVCQLLQDAGYDEKDFYQPRRLLPLTKLETLVGKKKFDELCADYIMKPQGKMTLVPETDRRPEANTIVLAKSEFAEPIDND